MFEFKKLFDQLQAQPTALFALLGLALVLIALIAIKRVKFSTRLITQIALMLALATVLKVFKLYTFPSGGSVTLGSMVPILIMAILYGGEVGLLTGFIFGVLTLFIEPYIVHPVQILFDYPLAFMAIGIAGYVKRSSLIKSIAIKLTKSDANSTQVDICENIFSAIIGIFARYICAIISGVAFFASYAPAGTSPLVYSITYNIGYLGPDALICLIILAILPLKQIRRVAKIN